MPRKLETITNVAIIILCLTVSGVLVKRFFLAPPAPEPPPAITKGEILDLPEALAPGDAELVLVAALAPACGFCDESLPFYHTLSERRNAEAADFLFVAAVRNVDHAERERWKLQAAGVDVDQIVVTDFKTLGVPGTPMLIVADRRGEVLGAWLGKLSEDQELEVFETLGFGEGLARASLSEGTASAVAATGGR